MYLVPIPRVPLKIARAGEFENVPLQQGLKMAIAGMLPRSTWRSGRACAIRSGVFSRSWS